MGVQVLVTTMNQDGFAIYNKMNLQTDAVIANQTNCDSIDFKKYNNRNVKIVSTSTIGISRNRNIALSHSFQDADIIIFSDDDLVFNDNYELLVEKEFQNHPKVEAIKFNIHDISSIRKISMKRIVRFEKGTRRNMSSSGVCGLAVKKSVLEQHNLFFNEKFGSGTKNYCGEDTIFIQEMFNKGIHLYKSPIDIAGIDQSNSSWFNGYEEKYFVCVGKVLAHCFPILCWIIAIRSSFKFSKNKKCNMSFFSISKCYFRGIKEEKKKL